MSHGRFTPFDLLANAVRAKEIVAVLVRHGFADLVAQLGAPGRWWRRLLPAAGPRRRPAERARLVLEELGPTFIKVGQMLSTRPDIIPADYIVELRRLQDAVPPEPFAVMRDVLREELGREPAEVFIEFAENPVASASLGQVYFARLRASGRPVAVKIQRPDLLDTIRPDLELIEWFIGQAHQRVATLRPFDLPAVFAEIRDGLLRELDYRHELANQEFFNATNPHPDRVFAPAAEVPLCTSRVMVMERIDGRRLDAAGLTLERARELAHIGARSLMHQVLIVGFFHGDPHRGNLLLTSDGRICFLDWGLAGHLTPRLREMLADLFTAAAAGDAERLVQLALSLAGPGSRPDVRQMEKEVILSLRENFNAAIGRQEIGRTIFQLLAIFGRNGINLSRDYVLMAKAVATIEEIGRHLDPGFDLAKVSRPIFRELHRARWGARGTVARSRSFISGVLAHVQELPARVERIFRRLEQDDLTIRFQHQGLEDLDDAINSASSRITLGVILGSLLIGSSLVMTTKIPPFIFGYPAFGIVGYIMAAMLGLWVVWDIVRHGRHR